MTLKKISLTERKISLSKTVRISDYGLFWHKKRNITWTPIFSFRGPVKTRYMRASKARVLQLAGWVNEWIDYCLFYDPFKIVTFRVLDTKLMLLTNIKLAQTINSSNLSSSNLVPRFVLDSETEVLPVSRKMLYGSA